VCTYIFVGNNVKMHGLYCISKNNYKIEMMLRVSICIIYNVTAYIYSNDVGFVLYKWVLIALMLRYQVHVVKIWIYTNLNCVSEYKYGYK